MRISLLLLLLPLLTGSLHAQQAAPGNVTIDVLSLFHPQVLTLTMARPTRVLLDGAATILTAGTPLTLRRTGSHLSVQQGVGAPRSVMQFTLEPTSFTLSVPGKLTRTYSGSLTIRQSSAALQPIVAMPVEAAVASIVAAEASADAAPEALKAQAIVARSYLLATPHRHRDSIACDSTHCQYLRAAPPVGSAATRAAEATAGLVLTWQTHIVAAMYARSCGGSTRALSPAPAGAYPFFAVRCEYCMRHPERWSRASEEALPTSESARIAFNREYGWAAIPSTTYTRTGDQLEGRGTGHGLGLCQLGAQALARRGQSYTAILDHYFPGAAITRMP